MEDEITVLMSQSRCFGNSVSTDRLTGIVVAPVNWWFGLSNDATSAQEHHTGRSWKLDALSRDRRIAE